MSIIVKENSRTKEFAVELGDDKIHLFFEVEKTNIAKKWFSELEWAIKNLSIKENHRFNGFHKERELIKANNELSLCIEYLKLNLPPEAFNNIEDEVNLKYPSQKKLNLLHRIFEDYRGSTLSPGSLFLKETEEFKLALETLNLLIHKIENLTIGTPNFVVTFKQRKRLKLNQQDYSFFTTKVKLGDVFINYCEVGRSLLEAFYSEDDIVSDNGIRPLQYYSPDFRVELIEKERDLIANPDTFNKWLSKNGYNPYEVTNSIGNIKVASLNWEKSFSGLTYNEALIAISRNPKVNKVFLPN